MPYCEAAAPLAHVLARALHTLTCTTRDWLAYGTATQLFMLSPSIRVGQLGAYPHRPSCEAARRRGRGVGSLHEVALLAATA